MGGGDRVGVEEGEGELVVEMGERDGGVVDGVWGICDGEGVL